MNFEVYLRLASLGLNESQTLSFMSIYGPPIKSTQYGTARQISSIVSRMAFGRPGKLKIKHLFLVPPTCLDRMAVGTY